MHDWAPPSVIPKVRRGIFGLFALKLTYSLAIIGAFVITAALASSVFFVTSLYYGEVNTIQNRLQIPAQATAQAVQQIGTTAAQALRDLQIAVQKDGRLTNSDGETRASLRNYGSKRGAARKIEIYDVKGAAIASNLATTPQVSVAGYDFFTRQIGARDDRLIVSELIPDPLDGTPVIVLSRRLVAIDGEILGVAATYLSADYLQKRLDSLSLPVGSTLTLFNDTGRMLVRTPVAKPDDPILTVDFSRRPIYDAFRDSGAEGPFGKFTTIDGLSRFIAGYGVKDALFIVTAGWNTDAALADWRHTAIVVAVATLLAVLVIGALFVYLIGNLSRRHSDELTLRRSQENLARAQRIAGVGSFERDLRTGATDWSEEFLRIWGLAENPSQATAEHLLALVHPEDRKGFVEGRDLALQNKPIPPLDFRIKRADGEIRILHREYGVVLDNSSNPVRMFGTIQDITDRKKTEIALRRNRETLARAQRLAGIGSFERDLITGEIEYSEELLHIHGVEVSDSETPLDILYPLVHPEDRDKVEAFRRQTASGTVPPPIDYRIRRPDGGERIIHRTCEIQFDENGLPVRIFGTIQDITKRKKAETALLHSRENMARAQQIANLGSFDHDLATGTVEWTDEMYRILGLEIRAVVPGPEQMLSFVHPDDRELFKQARAAEIEVRHGALLEYRIIRPDGQERVIRRESVLVCDDEERPVRYCGTWQDITERRSAEERERELERQLLHSQKLEALGTLAGGIAHDLNNTLVPIMALSKLTARRFEAGSLVRNNLETIHEASERARDLVRRVLAFSRKEEAERQEANLGAVVREALKLMRATLPTSIRIDATITDVPPIRADESQIHQVITNLVSNAAGAIGSRMGLITILLGLVSAANGADEACLSVVDTGCGVDDVTLHRIFEPFFTTKEVGEGTGLGLSIVHGIVVNHGGRIEVRSTVGTGTRFDLYFPLSSGGAAVDEPQKISRPAA